MHSTSPVQAKRSSQQGGNVSKTANSSSPRKPKMRRISRTIKSRARISVFEIGATLENSENSNSAGKIGFSPLSVCDSLYPIASICASICAKAASRAARRDGFEVLCERMFSRCRWSACFCRSLTVRTWSAARRWSSLTNSLPATTSGCCSAFAICSSTDLLSQPRAISSFYGAL
jgi:hypothetical protein